MNNNRKVLQLFVIFKQHLLIIACYNIFILIFDYIFILTFHSMYAELRYITFSCYVS